MMFFLKIKISDPSDVIETHIERLDGTEGFESLPEHVLANLERDRAHIHPAHERQRLCVHRLLLLLKFNIIIFMKFPWIVFF